MDNETDLLDVIIEVVKETVHSIVHTIKRNVGLLGTIIEFCAPYLMYVLGQKLAIDREMFSVGGEVFIPLFVWLIANFTKNIANKMNRGPRIPKPTKRFTEVDEDGVITIEESKIEELLVYTADLEDWMERKGWL